MTEHQTHPAQQPYGPQNQPYPPYQNPGPYQPHKPKKPRIFLKVFLAIMLAMFLAIAGCAALVGGAASEASKAIDAEQNKSAITAKQFKSLELGATKKAVIADLGKPADTQDMETQGLEAGQTFKTSCIYYNRKGGEMLEMYQLCFDNGELSSKNRW